jgi:hypothetical protein
MKKTSYVTNRNIVFHSHNAVHFPVPKVACTSLGKAFADLLGMSLEGRDLEEEVHWLDFPSLDVDQLNGEFEGYFRFGFTRNPWDRLVSLYEDKMNRSKYDLRLNRNFDPRLGFYPNMQFSDFVRVICEISDTGSNVHYQSQHVSLMPESLERYPDYVGKFENLSSDLVEVAEFVGFPKIVIPTLRRSSRESDFRAYYDGETRGIVAKRFQRDIEEFEYTFE